MSSAMPRYIPLMRLIRQPRPLGLLLLALLLCVPGCREAGPQMDVQVQVKMDSKTLPATGPVELTYVWTMAADAEPVSSDYLVFAHYWGTDGEIHWQDDHQPPIPTSQWKPGQTVEYTNIHFIPDTAPQGEITLRVGLYDQKGTGGKVILSGHPERKPDYEVMRFEVTPADQLPIIIYDQGWYDQEFEQGQPGGTSWRWCRQEAVCWIESPERPCALFLEIQAPARLLGAGQSVTLELEQIELATLQLDGPDRVIRRIPIPDQLRQDRDCVCLVLRTDKVLQSQGTGNGTDDRELGLKVYRLAVY
jgi:hypothetical protein